jgi:predicted RNA-binding Zn-ribbon protein involved in translation (DUF1610 family)
MVWYKTNSPLYLLGLFAFLVFVFTIYDIFFGKEWIYILLVLYFVIILLTLLLIYIRTSEKRTVTTSVEEFEKSLKGGLYHFKCPSCAGIFAIKKSKGNNKKPMKMTCPDCGNIGIIPSYPVCVEEEVPEKKSVKANFRCTRCGEGITVWAEGQELYKDAEVYSCPFCGVDRPLSRF